MLDPGRSTGRAPGVPENREEHEVSRTKKVLVWVLIAFAIYAIFRSPEQAAAVADDAIDGIVSAFRAIGRFFDALLNQ
jgi:hypothetical protein